MDISKLMLKPSELSNLNDKQILKIFDDETLSLDDRIILLEQNSKRINELPMNVFMKCIEYVDVDLMISDYINKINNMNYDELVLLIYEHLYDEECLLYILETPLFQKYLEEEKQNNKKPKLQIFKLFCEIHTYSGSEEKLVLIGEEINKLLPHLTKDPNNFTSLIDAYLAEVTEHIDELYINNDIMTSCINMLNSVLKAHIKLDSKMLKYYISLRLYELELDEYCKEVIIDYDDNPLYIGGYQQSTGILRISAKYMENVYMPVFEEAGITDNNFINNFLNLQMLKGISHELGHVEIQKKIGDIDIKVVEEKPYANYWYKNGLLHDIEGHENYIKNHDHYIEENQADLFAIFDIDKVVNLYFKEAFKEKELQVLAIRNCAKIIELYTEESEAELKISSPIQKFDKFFKEKLTTKLREAIPYVGTESLSVMEKILFGSDIPVEVLSRIIYIKNGVVVTTSIYEEIEPLIKELEMKSKSSTGK